MNKTMYINKTDVFGIASDNEDTLNILKEQKDLRIMDNFKEEVFNYEDSQKVKINSEYLKELIKLLKKMPKHERDIYLYVKNDMPLKAEHKNFTFIVAPKVDNS